MSNLKPQIFADGRNLNRKDRVVKERKVRYQSQGCPRITRIKDGKKMARKTREQTRKSGAITLLRPLCPPWPLCEPLFSSARRATLPRALSGHKLLLEIALNLRLLTLSALLIALRTSLSPVF
jgi:hypothetical protein